MSETNAEDIKKLEAVLELPESAELIDESFYVWETRFGLWSTMTQSGRKMLPHECQSKISKDLQKSER